MFSSSHMHYLYWPMIYFSHLSIRFSYISTTAFLCPIGAPQQYQPRSLTYWAYLGGKLCSSCVLWLCQVWALRGHRHFCFSNRAPPLTSSVFIPRQANTGLSLSVSPVFNDHSLASLALLPLSSVLLLPHGWFLPFGLNLRFAFRPATTWNTRYVG